MRLKVQFLIWYKNYFKIYHNKSLLYLSNHLNFSEKNIGAHISEVLYLTKLEPFCFLYIFYHSLKIIVCQGEYYMIEFLEWMLILLICNITFIINWSYRWVLFFFFRGVFHYLLNSVVRVLISYDGSHWFKSNNRYN